MTLKVQVVPVTQYQQNCSIIQCQATGLAAIVDPGGDIERIEAAITKMEATVEKILLTHGHMDHCAAADVLRQKLTVPMEGPERATVSGSTSFPSGARWRGSRALNLLHLTVGWRMGTPLPLVNRPLR